MLKTFVSSLEIRGLRNTIKRFSSIYLNKFLLKYPNLIIYPNDIMIEPTNICNLRCPLCSNKTMKRKKGFMTYDQFKYIIPHSTLNR